MALIDLEKQISQLQQQLSNSENKEEQKALTIEIAKLKDEAYNNISAYDRVYMARKSNRPHIQDYIQNIFDDFIELHGDRLYLDDQSIMGGIALLDNQPVTVIGHVKGRMLDENLHCNFGMSSPEGYRKALRLMKQAEKFHRPIITFIDTPGAYPGLEAEQHGIGEAIARNLREMSTLSVPVIAVVVGEGGSGGALALSVADRILMLENSVYSILSPEGFASILWKDKEGTRVKEAASLMKLTAKDLYEMKIIDHIIKEPKTGATVSSQEVYEQLKDYFIKTILELNKLSKTNLLNKRYQKYRTIGQVSVL